MNEQLMHVLNQMEILTSFSIAKRVTEEDVQKYFAKRKKIGKTEEEMSEMLRKKITSEIDSDFKNNKIPGLVTPQEFAKSMGVDQSIIDKMPELNRLITIIAEKILQKKYDKMELCYFLNSLVNILSLTEDDFLKFHRKNNPEDDDYDDDDDDEDDDEDDEDQK